MISEVIFFTPHQNSEGSIGTFHKGKSLSDDYDHQGAPMWQTQSWSLIYNNKLLNKSTLNKLCECMAAAAKLINWHNEKLEDGADSLL